MDFVERILVFKPGPIGDFLHSLPAVYALRKRYPGAHICMVASRENSDLVEANLSVDRKLYVPSTLFRGDVRGFLRFGLELRALRPDVFVDLRSNVKSFLLRNLSGARTVLAYRKQRKPKPGERRLHAAENLLRTVFPLTGATSDLSYPIRLREEDVRAADAYLAAQPGQHRRGARIVVLNPTVGPAIPSRLWPPEHFARLGGMIGRELSAAGSSFPNAARRFSRTTRRRTPKTRQAPASVRKKAERTGSGSREDAARNPFNESHARKEPAFIRPAPPFPQRVPTAPCAPPRRPPPA